MQEVQRIPVPRNYGIYTSAAIKRLREGDPKPGDRISIEDLSAAVGRDCHWGEPGYENVGTAIDYLLEECDLLWFKPHGEQYYQVATDDEKVAFSRGRMRRAGRQLRKGAKITGAVNEQNLSQESRRDHSLNRSLLGAMQILGSASSRRKLGKSTDDEHKPLSPQKVLEAILGSK